MDHFRTQYEKCYEGDEYYWGLEPAPFLDELLELADADPAALKVLDIGCGEGKDAVYMAQRGCSGCKTVFDVAPADLSPADRMDLIAHLL